MRRATAILLCVLAWPAGAGELGTLKDDAKSLATAPLRWTSNDWKRFTEGIGAVAIVMIADKKLEDAVQRNRSSFTDSVARRVTPFGGGRGLQVSAVLLGAGYFAHDSRLFAAGHDALEAQFWAAGVVTPLLKDVFGRARPNTNDGSHTFHFWSTDNPHNSFPSGHSTSAWAAATAIAAHYDGYVIPTIVYTLATSVSLARMNDHVHFPSDVLAGALIGRSVAKSITFRHQKMHVAPLVTPHGVGLMFALN
jgi:membrane-associated phospholipid phosphatase